MLCINTEYNNKEGFRNRVNCKKDYKDFSGKKTMCKNVAEEKMSQIYRYCKHQNNS